MGVTQPKWVRARNGWFFGVCLGMARTLGVQPVLVRALAVLSACLFGSGILIYLIAAITLPLEGAEKTGAQKKFLGVCLRVSKLTGLEVGLVRLLAVVLGLPSLGTSVLVYIGLHFILKDSQSREPGV